MKILFFSRLFYPHIGGVEKHLLETAKLLIKKGHKVVIVTERHLPELKLRESISGMEIFRIPNLKEGGFKKYSIWKWIWCNRKIIERFDLVHCHDVFFWYLPFRFLYQSKKVYTTFHGYESYPLKFKDIAVRKISEILSNGNICIGNFIEKWYKTNSTFISYGGVDLSNLKFSATNNFNKKSAVFIGRLDEQTGIKTYVNAVKLLRKKIKDFKFEVIGDGKFRKDIEKDFKVFGFQKKPEKCFQKYNFAFVSRYLSILEAMAAKKLVFAVYDNPLKEDYLRMAPFAKFIIILNSSSELVSKISFYLENEKEVEEITDKAYSWVKNYTWENVVNTYLKLWKINS